MSQNHYHVLSDYFSPPATGRDGLRTQLHNFCLPEKDKRHYISTALLRILDTVE